MTAWQANAPWSPMHNLPPMFQLPCPVTIVLKSIIPSSWVRSEVGQKKVLMKLQFIGFNYVTPSYRFQLCNSVL